jgi:hypothetical protein
MDDNHCGVTLLLGPSINNIGITAACELLRPTSFNNTSKSKAKSNAEPAKTVYMPQ